MREEVDKKFNKNILNYKISKGVNNINLEDIIL